MSDEKRKRPYRLNQRAAAQERTRARIAQAAMELHGTVGPARTSVTAVAARAGVQRATVYRHFPDEAALFAACSAHWDALHPAPDPSPWAAVGDPEERLVAALGDLYRWYREGEQMLANVFRDAPEVDALKGNVAGLHEYLAAIEDLLMRGRRASRGRRRRLRAAIGHALDFDAWRSLARRDLGDDEIVALMAGLVRAASRQPQA